jgi:hypothetical protein
MALKGRSFTFSNNHELRVSSDEISFENHLVIRSTKLPREIRFGVPPIEMYDYTIGYHYKIEILTEKEEIISISTKIYFSVGPNKRINMYNDIIDTL